VAQLVVKVARELPSPPIIVALSSTGILSTRDLLPFGVKFLYHTLLQIPHIDKINMENAIADGYESGKWVLVRGAWYTNGEKTGTYRVGETEMGYTISRRDVADFVVTQCIDGEGQWLGKRPVVVY
jgi:NAD(P)H-binding